jgi:hypothetical protein
MMCTVGAGKVGGAKRGGHTGHSQRAGKRLEILIPIEFRSGDEMQLQGCTIQYWQAGTALTKIGCMIE